MKGALYLVSTPIGNLEDITLRALRVLKEVDVIAAEDPQKTRRLLNHYQITTPLLKFHQHSSPTVLSKILQKLEAGQSIALVAEAGTPGLSDPGNKLVEEVVSRFKNTVKITSIPGPSALTAAIAVSGFNTNRFLFLGFLPKKKGRQKFLQLIKDSPFPVFVYESVYRIKKFLQELENLGIEEIMVARELTKKFETLYRGSPREILQKLGQDKIKGEFVVAINK